MILIDLGALLFLVLCMDGMVIVKFNTSIQIYMNTLHYLFYFCWLYSVLNNSFQVSKSIFQKVNYSLHFFNLTIDACTMYFMILTKKGTIYNYTVHMRFINRIQSSVQAYLARIISERMYLFYLNFWSNYYA